MTIGAKLAMAKEDIPARSTAPAMRSGPRSTMNHLECPRDAGWTSREAATAVPKSGQTRRSHRLCILVMHFCRCDLVSFVCNPWWARRDSNPRPRDYESPALTD